MKRPYRIVHDTSTASSRELADWLAKDGQLLVPLVELLEKGERAIDGWLIGCWSWCSTGCRRGATSRCCRRWPTRWASASRRSRGRPSRRGRGFYRSWPNGTWANWTYWSSTSTGSCSGTTTCWRPGRPSTSDAATQPARHVRASRPRLGQPPRLPSSRGAAPPAFGSTAAFVRGRTLYSGHFFDVHASICCRQWPSPVARSS